MSTTAVIPSPNSVAALPVKNENVNFAVVVKLDEAQKITSVRHTSSEKDITNLESPEYPITPKEKAEPETIAFKQTVIKPSAGTLEGFEQLIPDAEERLSIINKGLSAKFNQKIRTVLVEQDEAGNLAFQPVEPTYDGTSLVQEASQRVSASPTDKAIKMLGSLSPEMLQQILAQFAAINQG